MSHSSTPVASEKRPILASRPLSRYRVLNVPEVQLGVRPGGAKVSTFCIDRLWEKMLRSNGRRHRGRYASPPTRPEIQAKRAFTFPVQAVFERVLMRNRKTV